MPFSGMINATIKFFKSMQNEITKKYILFFFHFRIFLFFKKEKKKKKDYTTQKYFNSEKEEKEERKRRKNKKKKIKRKFIKIAIGILHTSYILSSIICRLYIYIYIYISYKLFHIHNILSSRQLVHWPLTQLIFTNTQYNSEMKNFADNILRLFGVKRRKLCSVNLC